MPDAVDVGGFADRQALVINARLHPADVVAHDEQDVWFLLLGDSRWSRTNAANPTAIDTPKAVRALVRLSRFLLKESGWDSSLPPIVIAPAVGILSLRVVTINLLADQSAGGQFHRRRCRFSDLRATRCADANRSRPRFPTQFT